MLFQFSGFVKWLYEIAGKIFWPPKKMSSKKKMTFSVSLKQRPGAKKLFLENNLFINLLWPLENMFVAPGLCLVGNCPKSWKIIHYSVNIIIKFAK